MKAEETYLSLVRAALWGKKAVWPVEQTEQLLLLNLQQGTGALVFPCVLEQDDLLPYARTQMKSVCMTTMQEHVRLQHTLAQAKKALEDAGIHPVLLKGAGLAELYPSPDRRQWGDIDLFVGKEQYHAAAKVMRDAFPNALKFDEELEHYKHYNLTVDGVPIEVHRVSASFQHPLDDWRYERFEKKGLATPEPEPTFNALFVFVHAWHHMLTKGANVRQLCDLALLLHHYKKDIDRAYLKHMLKALKLLDVWQLCMWILVQGLGLPADESVCYNAKVANRAERMLADLINGVLCKKDGMLNEEYSNRFIRKWRTMQVRFANAKRIEQYSPAYAKHMRMETLLHGASRLLAKDRHWE